VLTTAALYVTINNKIKERNMKKTAKIAVCVLAAAAITATLALAACDKDENPSNGTVSDSEWQTRLSFDLDTSNSYTVTIKNYSAYPKSQAAEKGDWSEYSNVTKVDAVNKIIYEVSDSTNYRPNDSAAIGGYVTTHSETYYLKYKDGFYAYYDGENPRADGYPEDNYNSRIQDLKNRTSMMNAYSFPGMKSQFKFNDSLGCYEMTTPNIMQQGNITTQLYFITEGIRMHGINEYEEHDTEYWVTDVNSTTVTVPQKVYAAIDAYILENK